jgi:predicted lipoprotein with Yx(FWY)xxD motif
VKLLRTTLLSAAGVSAALALAACSTPAPAAAPAPSTPATPSTAPGAPAATGAALSVTRSPLGSIVTDAQGRTLYRFDADTTSPPASNCSGGCAQLWPPALGDPATVTLNGVQKSLVGQVKRADGRTQLTLAGSPLYEYAGDTGPGQTNGQAVMNTWWAITPTGAKLPPDNHGTDPTTDNNTTTPGSNSGSGY